MFFWTGRGLWILGIASLFVLPFQDSQNGMSLGLFAAAVTVYLMRDWFEESSVFFIPARFWPIIFLLLSVNAYFL